MPLTITVMAEGGLSQLRIRDGFKPVISAHAEEGKITAAHASVWNGNDCILVADIRRPELHLAKFLPNFKRSRV